MSLHKLLEYSGRKSDDYGILIGNIITSRRRFWYIYVCDDINCCHEFRDFIKDLSLPLYAKINKKQVKALKYTEVDVYDNYSARCEFIDKICQTPTLCYATFKCMKHYKSDNYLPPVNFVINRCIDFTDVKLPMIT